MKRSRAAAALLLYLSIGIGPTQQVHPFSPRSASFRRLSPPPTRTRARNERAQRRRSPDRPRRLLAPPPPAVDALSSISPGGGEGGVSAGGDGEPTPSAAQPQHNQPQQPAPSSPADEDGDEISPGEREGIRWKLNRQFFSIAAPALVQLTAEPLASLVDTAYLGRLGPEVLGGAGVAISAQYAVSKLYNDPLLRTSISLVASRDGRDRAAAEAAASTSASASALASSSAAVASEEEEGGGRGGATVDGGDDAASSDAAGEGSTGVGDDGDAVSGSDQLSVAVSSALLLAFVVGAVQLLVYSMLAPAIIRTMGVDAANPMWHSAISYLKIRALGTPAATLWLVTNGVFRGLGDTTTPLIYSLLFTGLNAILDPLFIFTLHFGASGAAAGTAIAQYVALVPLLRALNRRVRIDVWGQLPALRRTLVEYLEAGGLVLVRTMGKVLAYAVCAREAALLGPIAAAAYNLTFQLGFATTQICESVAVAVQTLLAREISTDDSNRPGVRRYAVGHLIRHSIAVGGAFAFFLSAAMYLQRDKVLAGLTSSAPVREAARGIFPAVLVCQVLKGLAYPVNGIIMGALDWKFTMVAMWIANFVCVAMLRFGGVVTLDKIWWALAAFMGVQVVTGVARFQSRTSVWRVLRKS